MMFSSLLTESLNNIFRRRIVTVALACGASACIAFGASRAQAQQPEYPAQVQGSDGQWYPYPTDVSPPANQVYPATAGADDVDAYGSVPVDPTMIPPNVEGTPYAVQGGGYCYTGPHPVDTRVVPGPSWDPTEGEHIRPYPPVDMRLFALSNGCYAFTGDPRDFGYEGSTYAYYGAHPLLAAYGGGWCFMMGPHTHLWRPWSPYFTVVGSWNYWRGPYDPFFWRYWPYYSAYYRSYYPHYYGGGRFYRGGGYRVAPPIRSVPASAWRGQYPGRGGPVMRGAPAGTQMYRPMQAQTGMGGYNRGGGGPPAMGGGGARPFSPGTRPSFSPGPRPSFSPGPGGFGHSSNGGSFSGGGGSFHGGGGGGAFHGGGGGGAFHGGGGGGAFHGGGSHGGGFHGGGRR